MHARHAIRLATILLMFSILSVERVFAECPTNSLSQGCHGEGWGSWSTSGSGMYDENILPNVAPWTAGQACPTACYDLKKGILVSNGWSDPWNDCGTFTNTTDVYQIAGIPPGAPISFQAELWVTGTVSGNGDVRAQMSLDSGGYQENVSSTSQVDFKLTIPVVRSVGEPFQLNFLLSGKCYPFDGQVHSTAVIHFTGLPQGAYVISCQNYDLPVPTNSRTWGSVKAAYR